MKQYLLFAGYQYYPSGGWADFIGSYSSQSDARKKAKTDQHQYEWWHIVKDGKIIETGREQ